MKFDNNSLLEQIIRDTLFEQKSSNTKIPKSLKSKKKKNDEDSEDFKIVAWTDAKLNNKATFYTNKLKETGRVPDLTSGWLNGFTVITKHKEDASKEPFIDQIRQNTEYGENSKYANGDHIYIYFIKQFKQIVQKVVNRHVVDIVILPLDKVSSKKVIKSKEVDNELDSFPKLPDLIITDPAGKEHTYSAEWIRKQRFEELKPAWKIQQELETKHGIKFDDEQNVTFMDIAMQPDYDEVEIIAKTTAEIGRSEYMSFRKFKDESYINENSINPKKQVMQEQEQWKSPEYEKSRAQIKQDKWAMPEIPKTTAQIKSETENFDETLMSITGDMESNYTIGVNSTGFDTDYKTPTDTDVISQISDLNAELIALTQILQTEYTKSDKSTSALYKLMDKARKYGANIETGDDLFGMIPFYGLGVNFGDDEKLAAQLFNTWWGKMIKNYNTKQESASNAVKQNLIIRYNERVLTKLWEWTMVQIANDKQNTFTGEFVKINNDGTWGSFSTYKFPWKAI